MSNHSNTEKTNHPTDKLFTQVVVRGTVHRKTRLAKMLPFVIASANSEAGKCDFPRFIAFTNLSEHDKAFSLGDRVTVTGYIHANKKHPHGTLIPTSIKLEKSRLEAAFSKEDYKPDCNQVIMRGKLACEPFAVRQSTVLATFETRSANGATAYIHATCYNNTAAKLQTKHKGDIVEAIGYIRTKPMSEVKEREHAQIFVVTAIK